MKIEKCRAHLPCNVHRFDCNFGDRDIASRISSAQLCHGNYWRLFVAAHEPIFVYWRTPCQTFGHLALLIHCIGVRWRQRSRHREGGRYRRTIQAGQSLDNPCFSDFNGHCHRACICRFMSRVSQVENMWLLNIFERICLASRHMSPKPRHPPALQAVNVRKPSPWLEFRYRSTSK